jgi:hypothetical protein
MMIFAIGVEHALDTAVQCPHDADAGEHRRPAERHDQDQGLHRRMLPALHLDSKLAATAAVWSIRGRPTML